MCNFVSLQKLDFSPHNLISRFFEPSFRPLQFGASLSKSVSANAPSNVISVCRIRLYLWHRTSFRNFFIFVVFPSFCVTQSDNFFVRDVGNFSFHLTLVIFVTWRLGLKPPSCRAVAIVNPAWPVNLPVNYNAEFQKACNGTVNGRQQERCWLKSKEKRKEGDWLKNKRVRLSNFSRIEKSTSQQQQTQSAKIQNQIEKQEEQEEFIQQLAIEPSKNYSNIN